MKFLALSGSLRVASYNTALLRASILLAPVNVEIILYAGMGSLPLFNPDLETTGMPETVIDFRAQLQAADGVLIASPEYAHGVTGVMKNALDWAVSGEQFVGKHIALFNTSPRASHAYAALKETVTVMSGRIVEEASITLPLLGSRLDTAGIVAHPEISFMLKTAISEFARSINAATIQ